MGLSLTEYLLIDALMEGKRMRTPREFKFRAWDKKDGMTTSFSIHASGLVAYKDDEWLLDGEKPILMQFTGVMDSKRNDIYEGDMVLARWTEGGDERIAEVYYNPAFGCFFLEGSTYPIGEHDYLEVMGNIHEGITVEYPFKLNEPVIFHDPHADPHD